MPDYHIYHVEYTDSVTGRKVEQEVQVHEEHHREHGFDDNGKLKNTSMMARLVADAIGIGKELVSGFKYFGKIIRK
jgi:hypothetical protein